MGCINVKIALFKRVTPIINKVNSIFNIQISRKNLVNVEVAKLNRFNVSCGLICSVNKSEYIILNKSILWLVPENNYSEELVIYSNTDWKIN